MAEQKNPRGKAFDALHGWRFPASAVRRAAHVDAGFMTNVIAKSELILCSDTAGQGRARQFCLADVYQFALLRQISILNGRLTWTIEALNRSLFAEEYNKLPAPDARMSELTKELQKRFCDDNSSMPVQYTERNDKMPWFAWMNSLTLLTGIPQLMLSRMDGDMVDHLLLSGVFVNITYTLADVDMSLVKIMGIEVDA